VAVRALKSGEDAAGVHILFIGAGERARLSQHVAAVAGRPVLVVSETEDAIQRGATINFVLVDQRVRFEIALNKAEQSGLVVSSRLLSVATRVYRGELPRRTFFALGPVR
jgi:multidrug resistance efflux pump